MFRRSPILIAAAALALAVPTVATAAPTADEDSFEKAPTKGPIGTSYVPRALDGNAKVTVMVQLKGDPVAVAEAKADRSFSKTERAKVKQKLRKAQDAISGDISAKGGKVMSRLQSAYNGMRVQIARNKAQSLTKLPGVAGVHVITPKRLDNAVSVPYLGVPQVWQSTGYTGKGVKVGIIDTGIDYTHADFGGPGTTAAYDEAHANSAAPADPALFGTAAPRVKGGYDFVGDDYDASADAGSPALVPHPDPNPLDCNGHGSHVAGTAGGSGVTADGKTYAGPYNANTPNTAFKVGPGVAPQVDLYALRVFGCEGSTDVVVEAIDWAVDHDLDVINMSLGSPFGSPDDPDAVAASNAVGAGVVVVTSSGNEGPNAYMTGTPGTGNGVISVAAVDSNQTLPGAEITLGSSKVSAINANGADLPSGDFTVVGLTDNPATTTEDESLGCSVEAFQNAGITSGSKQLAVVSRGVCARVAKAIYGQQAGAGAVVMVNTDAAYPPYEGPITSNPDTGDRYRVTIPFLGVRSTDGATVRGANGQSASLAALQLDNPGYKHYASFSSRGPASGDSGVGPDVAAPGVSIASAGVGTGSDAAVISGTSMASPHVAGVAALSVQAHPGWRAYEVAASVVSTADPGKVDGYSVTLGGAGLVDAAQTVRTQTYATGDVYRTTSGYGTEANLSFGFAEPSKAFFGTKVLTIRNRGNRAVTYTVSGVPSSESLKATVKFSKKRVTVPARGTARVLVSLAVSAGVIGSSLLEDDLLAFKEVSGNVLLTSSAGELRVPYLLVPRAQAKVTASLANQHGWAAQLTSNRKPSKPAKPVSPLTVKLANRGGALDAVADFYTWGLSDRRDVPTRWNGSGYDLRAAGVRSLDVDGERLLVFALNTHDRWSNAAGNEFDVYVDANRDGTPEYVVFAVDSGLVRAGSADGLSEVFIADLKTGALDTAGFYAQAPTDSSTILLPVFAGDVGVADPSGAFAYTAVSYTLSDDTVSDEFDSWATYDSWAPAIATVDPVTVQRNRTAKVSLTVDPAAYAAQKPKGLMVVVVDNKAGSKEALLLSPR